MSQNKKMIVWAVLAISFGAGVLAMTSLGFFKTGRLGFFFRGKKYDQMVVAVKSHALQPGQTFLLQANSILAERGQDGNYLIQIITSDQVHLGFGGYLFHDKVRAPTDPPLLPQHADGYQVQWINSHWDAFQSHSV